MISRLALWIAIVCHVVLLAACAAQRPATVEAPLEADADASEPAGATTRALPFGSPEGTPLAGGNAAASNEYRLGPGDIVKITVYGNQDLTTETEVSQGGKISFPLVGEIAVAGMTRGEAEKAISKALAKGKFVPNAYVNMLISQYRSQQVSVVGEVNKPGNYAINKASSVTELIAMAGGITPKGSNVISIIRKNSRGGTEKHQVDVRNIFAGNDKIALSIRPDDVIYIPPLPVFYIYGEVRSPGSYPLTPDMTVRQALSVGGGLTVRGTERGIRVERKDKDGKTDSRRPNLDEKLAPDDVVQVQESWF
jgi:polysaccharide export outer membrane protein